MRRFILFLIRLKLGVRKYESFRFSNQKSKDVYFFSEKSLIKLIPVGDKKRFHEINPDDYAVKSEVSLNFILSDECSIIKNVKLGE